MLLKRKKEKQLHRLSCLMSINNNFNITTFSDPSTVYLFWNKQNHIARVSTFGQSSLTGLSNMQASIHFHQNIFIPN